jgi:hypothetical protein
VVDGELLGWVGMGSTSGERIHWLHEKDYVMLLSPRLVSI